MKIFILGGVKSGKSMFAQCASRYLSQNSAMVYWATMLPMDSEDDKRVARHIQDRSGWGFETIEEGRNLDSVSRDLSSSSVLFDSVTAFVQNRMFAFDSPDGQEGTGPATAGELSGQIERLAARSENFIAVSDYIFSNPNRYDEAIFNYMRVLGDTHIAIAKFSDLVIECSFSQMKAHKNTFNYDISPILEDFYSHMNHLEYSDI